jgi:hypothetical protein
MKNNPDIPATDTTEIKQLINRLKQGELDQGDAQLIEKLLNILLTIVSLLQRKRTSIVPTNGFTGIVDFTVSGSPSGASVSFNPPSVNTSGSSTMTVTTSASTPTGAYQLIITGASGSLQRTTSVTLVVANPSADFSLSATPSSRSVRRNQSATYTVTVTPLDGFTGAVTFSGAGLPGGASASFNPTSVTGSGTTTMTVTAGNPRGAFTLTIAGTSGSLQHNTAVTLTVTK